jgi:hypothetical protein
MNNPYQQQPPQQFPQQPQQQQQWAQPQMAGPPMQQQMPQQQWMGQPGMPMPQQQWMGQPGMPMPQQAPQGMPMPSQAPAAPPPPLPTVQSLPQYQGTDAAMVAAAYAAAEEERARQTEARNRQGLSYWDGPKCPTGQKWGQAPKGAKATAYVWLCPTAVPGTLPFRKVDTHFWKSAAYPKGVSILCLGAACPLCTARNLLFSTGNAADAEKANAMRRARTQAYWSIISLDDPYEMLDTKTGQMAPLVWRMPGGTHQDLMDCFKMVEEMTRKTNAAVPVGSGMDLCVNPQHGRAFAVTKEKVGAAEMNIEWKIQQCDSSALPQQFWPALYNLKPLDNLDRAPTQDIVRQAMTDLGLPWFPTVTQLWQALPAAAAPAAGAPQQPQAGGFMQQPVQAIPGGAMQAMQQQVPVMQQAPQPMMQQQPQQQWAGQMPAQGMTQMGGPQMPQAQVFQAGPTVQQMNAVYGPPGQQQQPQQQNVPQLIQQLHGR